MKSRADINAQLNRIYAGTGGPYSNNPRRIAADRTAARYLSNIANSSQGRSDARRTGEALQAGNTAAARLYSDIANYRKYGQSVYMRGALGSGK